MPSYQHPPGLRRSSTQWWPRFKLAALATLLAASIPATKAQGGSLYCANQICVVGVVDGDSVLYQLQSSLGFNELGWMAVGFGTSMLNSAMVITWPNAEGTITLSQRSTTIRQMPVVVPNPPERANLEWGLSNLATNFTTITFRYPRPADLSRVNMIYAYSRSRPPSPDPGAAIERHTAAGTFSLDLTQVTTTLASGTFSAPSMTRTSGGAAPTGNTTNRRTSTVSGNPTATSVPNVSQSTPLSAYQRKLVNHGILVTVGFLVLLPLGVLIPRYTRTIPALRNKWFTAHYVVQFFVSAPIIFAGWALGYQSASYTGGGHFIDTHKRVGLALLIMYLIQMALGIIIHYFKPKQNTTSPTASGHTPASESNGMLVSRLGKSGGYVRPPQNYLHAILGLSIIGLAFYNVRQGYRYELPAYAGIQGTDELKMVNSWWLAWVVIIPVLYLLGLALLPRQYRMERNGPGLHSNESASDLVPMSQSRSQSRA